ncbi:MAG: phosphatase PAP2 family protein [Planctomycetota bacterium]|nr:MAG: phosphatase PAP2 family protein [Planctomycetota bacterium]
MKKILAWIEKWQKPLFVLFMFLAVFPFYLIINEFLASRQVKGADLTTSIDQAIPFMPYWEFIYVSIYMFVLFPAVYIKHNQTFRRAFYAFFFIQIFAFAIFLIYPTKMIRAEHLVNGKKDFISWGVRLNYHLDKPYNCFPSLHVGNSYLAAIAVLHVDPLMGILLIIWGTLIAFSTMAVKHHFFYDVLGGTFLAILGYLIFLYPLKKKSISPSELCRSRKVLWIPVLIYLGALLFAYCLFLAGLELGPVPVSR